MVPASLGECSANSKASSGKEVGIIGMSISGSPDQNDSVQSLRCFRGMPKTSPVAINVGVSFVK